MKKSTFELLSLFVLLTIAQSSPVVASATAGAEWFSLFDSKILAGWRTGGNNDTFSVWDGMIVADGPQSHLFYAGPIKGHDFTNFELKVDVKTMPKAEGFGQA